MTSSLKMDADSDQPCEISVHIRVCGACVVCVRACVRACVCVTMPVHVRTYVHADEWALR